MRPADELPVGNKLSPLAGNVIAAGICSHRSHMSHRTYATYRTYTGSLALRLEHP
jgi:hypothetical protein